MSDDKHNDELAQMLEEIDPTEPVVLAMLWFGRQITVEMMPLNEQMEHGYDRDLLVNQAQGAGAMLRNNVYGSQAEYFDHVATKVTGLKGLDCSASGWKKRVPFWIKSNVGARMQQVISLDEPIIAEQEKND